jgi:hypothetical protein
MSFWVLPLHTPPPGGISLTSFTSDRRARLFAAALATVLAPATILAHEAGHFLGYVVFGFPSPKLHYASAGWDGLREFTLHLQAGELVAAGSIANIGLSGITSAIGPLVTYLAIGTGLWALHRFESIGGAALAVAASARVIVLLPVVTGQSQNSDEARVSQALSVPEMPLHVLGFAACIVAIGGSFVLLRRQGRARLLAPLIVGTVFGAGLWMGLLGPMVLP